MKEQEYTYYAFISYNHRDEKWAKLIQRKLEHYRLPLIARKEIGEDFRIRPVFRYVTNLSLGDLRENITKELESSKYLIVVCSPNSAHPNIRGVHWVNDEIKRFISLGRSNRILPVIVDGVPNSGDSTECFPPALRDADIAGADIVNGSRQSRKIAFLKIIARLLDLQPDQLIRHAEVEERRKKRLKWLKMLPLFVLCVVGGVFAWDSTRIVNRYFADYVDSFGLPEGIFPLEKEQIRGRHRHYRFEYQGYQYGSSPHADSSGGSLFGFRRKLNRVVFAHSSGRPLNEVENFFAYERTSPIQDFEYDSHNRLQQIKHGKFNGDGKESVLERRFEFYNEGGVTNGLVKFLANAEGQLSPAYGASRATARAQKARHAEIAQHLIRRTPDGRVLCRRFLNSSGENAPDADGVFGFEYEYDTFGRVVATWHIVPAEGSYMRCSNQKGIAGVRYIYKHDHMVRKEFVEEDGKKTIRGEDGWAIFEIAERDAFGNPTLQLYRDARGNLALNDDGYAQMRNKFDNAGNVAYQAYYDTKGNRTSCNSGFAAARCEYDSFGNRTHTRFLDIDDNPVWHKDGYVSFDSEYDLCGNKIKEVKLGVAGELVTGIDGVAIIETAYDKDGNKTQVSYFGSDGKPTFCDEGYAGLRYEYGLNGKLIALSYLGLHGELIFNKEGIATIQYNYDKRGNMTRASYFDTNGHATTSSEGFASVRVEYDSKGNRTHWSVFDVNGKSVLDKDGVASVRFEYDVRGNLVKESNIGLDGKAVLSREDNAATCEYEYDNKGNRVSKRMYDIDGNPARDDEEVYGWEKKYDMQGRETQVTYIDADGEESRPCKRGYSKVKYEYDRKGNIIKKSFFWGDKLVVDYKTGVSTYAYAYNEAGKKILESCLGIDGNPVLCKEGYAQRRYEYNARGQQIMCVSLGLSGELIAENGGFAQIEVAYDNYMRVARYVYRGADGNKTLRDNLFAEVKTDYDNKGLELTNTFYGVDCNVVRRQIFGYDSCARKLSVSVYEQDGNSSSGKLKFSDNSSVTYEYDQYGRTAKIINALHVFCQVYDDCGRIIRIASEDKSGNIVTGPCGWAEAKYAYDELGRPVVIEFFGTNMTFVVSDGRDGIIQNPDGESNQGCHKQCRKYHGNSYIISELDNYSLTNYPCLWGIEGLWHEKSIRNNEGEILSLTWYDIKDRRLPMSAVPYFCRVAPNSIAANAGIQDGDIMCCVNNNLTINSDVGLDFDVVRGCFSDSMNKDRIILFARKSGQTWAVHKANLPAGPTGLSWRAKMIANHDLKEILMKTNNLKE